jgi:hypothetical protein
VNQDQVALVPKLREERGVSGGSVDLALQFLQSGNGFSDDVGAFAVRAGPPCSPVEAEELVEKRGAFKSKRDGRKIGQGKHLDGDLYVNKAAASV